MTEKLVLCEYGNVELGADCCFVTGGDSQLRTRCKVFDWEECPYRMKVEGCGTCAHASAMTESDGARMVDCSLNDLQMYSPYATECKHWEKALDKA